MTKLWCRWGLLLILGVASQQFAGEAKRFDFGPPGQAVAAGFQAVDHALVYQPDTGYGWESPWGFDFANGDGKPLTLDGIGGRDTAAEREATFVVDLPPGPWWLTVWLGNESPREGRFGQCVSVNSKVLLAPPGVGGWGKVFERRLPLLVENGQARIRFFTIGEEPNNRLSLLGMTLEPAGREDAQAVRLAWQQAPLEGEILGRTLRIGEKDYLEVGRRREIPLGVLPEPWRQHDALVFSRPNPGDILDYSVPLLDELTTELAAFGVAGDVEPIAFGLYAAAELQDVRYGLSELVAGEHRIGAEQLELFTVTCHPQSPSERPGGSAQIMPELLEKRWPFDLAAGRTQPLYLRVHLPPGQAPGVYRGTLTLTPAGMARVQVAISVRVLPLTLQTPPDKVWHLFADTSRWFTMDRRELEREIDDLLAHGINSFNGGYPPLSGAYLEEDGRIVDAWLGRLEEGLRYAVSQGYRGPVMLGSTSGLILRFRGWSVSARRGEARHDRVDGFHGKHLRISHASVDAETEMSQIAGIQLTPGESVRFAFRYRASGDVRGQLGVRFMRSYKRDPVVEGRVDLAIRATEDWQQAWAVTTVPEDASYAQIVGFFRGRGVVELDDVELLPASRADVNFVVNPGFERSFEPLDLNESWPADFRADYQDTIRALSRVGERLGLPIYIVGTDEAGNNPDHAYRELEELRSAHAAGAHTWCNLAPYLVDQLDGVLDATCFYGDMLGGPDDCRQLLAREHQAGRRLYTITSGTYEGQDKGHMPNRYGTGFFFWRSGLDGTAIWTFQRPVGDPYDDFDGPYRDHLLVYPPREPGGEHVPTLAWEGIREGWKDYRYIHTLEAATRAASGEAAERGEAVLTFARQTIPWYNEYDPARFDNGDADQLRWLIAWTLLQMQQPVEVQEAPPVDQDLIQLAFAAEGQPAAKAFLICPQATGAPELDGQLGEDAWQHALVLDGFERHVNAGVKAEAKTELRVMHDAQNLYLGLRCEEPAMDQLKTAATDRDGNVWADDSIEIFVDTNHDRFSYLQLCFNAAGTQADIQCAGGYNFGNNIFQVAYGRKKIRDLDWNGEWQVKTSRHASYWEAEVVLPFETIGRESDLMGFFVGRNRRVESGETSSMVSIGFFHQPDRYPSLLLAGARQGVAVIEHLGMALETAGSQQIEMSLRNQPYFRLGGLVSHGDQTLKLPEEEAHKGQATLSLTLAPEPSTVQLDVATKDGELLYRLTQPVAPPPQLELLSGPRVLEAGEPSARYALALRLSDLDRTRAVLGISLVRDGKTIASHARPVAGSAADVTLDTSTFPPGFYSLQLHLEVGDHDVQAVELPLAIVPSFTENGARP